MKNITIDNLDYYMYMSDEVTNDKKTDFLSVVNTVFGCREDIAGFDKKYKNNIYGSSIIVVVYDKDKPVAARAMWRNDVEGMPAYQPCDTAVCSEYRGRGIFGHMTDMALESANGFLIYNYPNNNSRPLYKRRGWQVYREYYLNLMLSNAAYDRYNGEMVDEKYLNWWFEGRSNVFKLKRFGQCYLVRQRKKGIYIIIGRISADVFKNSPMDKVKWGVVFYRSTKKPIYKTSSVYTLYKNDGCAEVKIPLHKMDAI